MMKFEDLTNEQIEKAKECTTREEKLAFIKEYSIEVPDDMPDGIAGGYEDGGPGQYPTCPKGKSPYFTHKWEKNGKTRPGTIFGDVWPDHEYRCTYCGETEYRNLGIW